MPRSIAWGRPKQGETLRELREKTGMSIAQICELTEVPYTTWRNWEKGISRTSNLAILWLETMLKLKNITDSLHTLIDPPNRKSKKKY